MSLLFFLKPHWRFPTGKQEESPLKKKRCGKKKVIDCKKDDKKKRQKRKRMIDILALLGLEE